MTMRRMRPANTPSQKSQTKTIPLLEADPKDIALMIVHLYTGLYTDIASTPSSHRTIFSQSQRPTHSRKSPRRPLAARAKHQNVRFGR